MSSFANCPQYKEHFVQDGKCIRCGMSIPYEGVITTRAAFDTNRDITFIGALPHSQSCV
jgi:hypothetical protein